LEREENKNEDEGSDSDVETTIDERLVPDLVRGRCRSIGGDLDVGEEGYDVGEEGSEQIIVTLQSLHHGPLGYQHTHT
jgi:hypothetical protein